MAQYVITANRVLDGAVVYVADGRRWTTRLVEARPFAARKAGDDDLAWARTREAFACDPHLIKVALGDAGPVALDTKQRIRAAGPEVMLAALGFLDARPDARHIHKAELPDDTPPAEAVPEAPPPADQRV